MVASVLDHKWILMRVHLILVGGAFEHHYDIEL